MKKEPRKKKKKRYRRRKCKGCQEWFMPQPHNAYHQEYCTAPLCRLASKRESARRYRNKQRKNRNKEEDKAEVIRVQLWRHNNPGYWRNTTRSFQFSLSIRLLPAVSQGGKKKILVCIRRRKGRALQDLYLSERPCRQRFRRNLNRALRDFINSVPGTWYPRKQKPRKRYRRRIPALW